MTLATRDVSARVQEGKTAPSPLFSFANVTFDYDPFPIGLATDILPGDFYEELLLNWPAAELFEFKKSQGNKYVLSELHNPQAYRDFVRSCPPWQRFYAAVKSKEFVYQVLDMLLAHHIDLGLHGKQVNTSYPLSGLAGRIQSLLGKLKRAVRGQGYLNVRFEFSMLPADGGCVKPHTDAPGKIITLVLSMVREGEWDHSFGGGTDVLRPKDMTKNYNHLNKQLEFDEVEVLKTFPFNPNQCVIFIKTFNSLHSVFPMTGAGSKAMRKTITLNIWD
jgi:hypothetical protein